MNYDTATNDSSVAAFFRSSGISDDSFFNTFFAVSVILFTAAVIFAVYRWKKSSDKKNILTSLRILTLGTFISCFVIHLPFYYYGKYYFGDPSSFIRPIILSIHSTLQAFVLGFNFKDLLQDLPELNGSLNMCYTFWVSFLYIVAPILTLTNILSLFNAFLSELRIKRNYFRRRPLCVFSEMNEQSIAIAQSIEKSYEDLRKDKKNKRQKPRKPLLVFTDFYPKDDEPDQNMLQSAQNLKAVCVKTDITHLKLAKKRYPIEFYIIGRDDSENMEQAIKLNDEYKDSSKCSVYVYSSKPNAGYILDTIDKGELTVTSRSLTKENAKGFLENRESANSAYSINDSYYYIRRVNVVDAFTVKALTDKNLTQSLSEQAKAEKTVSVMIVSLGLYGTSFLKNALWLYQMKGCTLKLHIIESENKETLRDRIAKEMPGLAALFVKDETEESLLHYRSDDDGDCRFDICVYHSVDCESSNLNDLILQQNRFAPAGSPKDEKSPNRFTDVRAAFVTLGDDNKDIETAVILRGLFDKIKSVRDKDMKNDPNEQPLIYSIVYDNRTAQNLNCGSTDKAGGSDKGIICYNGVPYHIHFIGRMSEHYHYDTIREMKQHEFNAIYHHVEWIHNESDLRDCFRTDADSIGDENTRRKLRQFRQEMQEYFNSSCGGREEWNDAFFYYTDEELEALKAKDEPIIYDKDKIIVSAVAGTIRSYDRFEYFRDSSVAKETYCKIIRGDAFRDYFSASFGADDHITEKPYTKICSCDRCLAFRESEHMRWNAYMIAKGYRYDPIRNDRAKTHPDIQPWQNLPVPDRYKD